MRRKLLAIPLCIVAGGLAWTVLASFLYCQAAGKPQLFVFPYAQFFSVVPYWNYSRWMEVLVIGSAAFAAMPIALVALVIYQRSSSGSAVYGNTEWATRRQMKANRIATTRRPF